MPSLLLHNLWTNKSPHQNSVLWRLLFTKASNLPNNSWCLIVLKESFFDFQKTKIHLHNLKLKIETNWDVAGPRLDVHQKMPYWICNAIASNQLRPNLVIFNCYRYYLLGIPKCKKEVWFFWSRSDTEFSNKQKWEHLVAQQP